MFTRGSNGLAAVAEAEFDPPDPIKFQPLGVGGEETVEEVELALPPDAVDAFELELNSPLFEDELLPPGEINPRNIPISSMLRRSSAY